MSNFITITAILAFIGAVLRYYVDVIMLDVERTLLNERFENWWQKVKYYSKERRAVALVKEINTFFGFTIWRAAFPLHATN